MELQKTHFRYELTDSGWRQVSGAASSESTNGAGLISIQVTEYSHDGKPDIWYKPEIVYLCEDREGRALARAQFIKYGLPAIVRQTCWADLDELKANILSGLQDSEQHSQQA